MPGTAAKVRMSEKQLAVLEELSRSRTAGKGVVQRALILVLGFQGLLNEQIAEEVGLNRQQVGVWRKRWRNQVAAVERSRSSWRQRAEIGEATAQREQAERVALESQLQQIREQSQEREAELAALRAQLAASEEAEKKGR